MIKITLIYKFNNKKYTLEQLISYNKQTQEIWRSIIIDELNYWDSFFLDDLIWQASCEFQDELYELKYDVFFTNMNNEKYDYNAILDALRK